MKSNFLILHTLLVVIFFDSVLARLISHNDGFTLRVIHTNDMHSRFEQTSAIATECQTANETERKCYGGFARLATLIREARTSNIPTLFLNAGDTYQGTAWFSVHKWKIVSKFLNILKPDAMSLGNHEFDDGPDGLVPFIREATFPIVTANLDLSNETELAATPLKKSIILNVKGHKIGIIGYVTPQTELISFSRNVKFLDEITEIRKEVKKLQSQGIKILIAVGHSGFAVDKKIAAEVDGIDLVIGGHTNTFLYTGIHPDIEIPEGLYPTEIMQESGKKAYVVQAYAYTKYLENLTIDFDHNGAIESIFGDPILLDSSIKEAQDVLAELEKWRPALDDLAKQEVGSTTVLIDGDSKSCRRQECNFGNLITDAIVNYHANQYSKTDGWTDAPIAFVNAGGIRSSIDRTPSDMIMMSDVLAALPFNTSVVKLEILGEVLLEVLEWSVYTLDEGDTSNLNGAFLQYSGIQVTYDLSKPGGSRVISVFVRCSKCRVPSYKKLKNNSMYSVLTGHFLRNGGDGYKMLVNLKWSSEGITTDAVLSFSVIFIIYKWDSHNFLKKIMSYSIDHAPDIKNVDIITSELSDMVINVIRRFYPTTQIRCSLFYYQKYYIPVL
ncbi:protein 5NUC-like isoform X2 [Aphidius gifuensis]|uniref:protein 5NUC-like isoform X2 n=1 Tax=Aphidius gifuensis TaxID=684658 RepID=UPI001CDCF5DB|nr:protein 5NUC-like isoform X2 [Aphidius gifuensis]